MTPAAPIAIAAAPQFVALPLPLPANGADFMAVLDDCFKGAAAEATPTPLVKPSLRPMRAKAESLGDALPFPIAIQCDSLPARLPGPWNRKAISEAPASAAPAPVNPLSIPQQPGDPVVMVLRHATPPAGGRAFSLELSPSSSKPGDGAPGDGAPANTPSRPNVVPPPAAAAEHNAADEQSSDTPAQQATTVPEKRPQPPTPIADVAPAPTPVQNTQPPAHSAQPARPSTPTATAALAQPDVAPRPIPAPAQHIALRVATTDDRLVDIRLVSRAGEVHVTVNTPDETLARTMRTELGGLTGKLSQAGYGVQVATIARDDAGMNSRGRDSAAEQGGAGHRHEGSESEQRGRQRKAAWFLQDEDSEA